MPHKPFDLEDRLIRFAVLVLDYVETLPSNDVGRYFRGQMIRSGTSPALNYGEAQAAESRRDFSHKIQIVLKELRETFNAARILLMKNLGDQLLLSEIVNEGSELVAIFTQSVKTVKADVQPNRRR